MNHSRSRTSSWLDLFFLGGRMLLLLGFDPLKRYYFYRESNPLIATCSPIDRLITQFHGGSYNFVTFVLFDAFVGLLFFIHIQFHGNLLVIPASLLIFIHKFHMRGPKEEGTVVLTKYETHGIDESRGKMEVLNFVIFYAGWFPFILLIFVSFDKPCKFPLQFAFSAPAAHFLGWFRMHVSLVNIVNCYLTITL